MIIREKSKSKITLGFQVWVIGDLVIMLVNKLNLVLSQSTEQSASQTVSYLYLSASQVHPLG